MQSVVLLLPPWYRPWLDRGFTHWKGHILCPLLPPPQLELEERQCHFGTSLDCPKPLDWSEKRVLTGLWRQHETAPILHRYHGAPRATGRPPPTSQGPWRRNHIHSYWVVPAMREIGQLKASGRQIPGGDARHGIQGSSPGEEITQMQIELQRLFM